MQLTFATFLLCTICAVSSIKILGISPIAAYSHYSLGKNLMAKLVEKGHDVTFISPFKEKNSKYRNVELTGFHERMEERRKEKDLFTAFTNVPLISVISLHKMGHELTNRTLGHPNVKKLLASNEKFDVVIIEIFANEALTGICHHFNAPCVILSSIASTYWTNHLVGNPANPAYVIQIHFISPGSHGLLTRLHNTALTILTNLFFQMYVLPQQNALLKEHFPNAPELSELLYETPLVLLNSHISTSPPVPHVPNMIEIGGYHVEAPKKLPQDLQTYLDDAKEGVVYFSMGSNLKSRDMAVEKRDGILRALSKLKLKVLWKFEEDDLPGKPSNLMVMKWLPQNDILAHPNVKLFITHGGLLSTIEAIYHGVPVIGIPIYGDQSTNMMGAVAGGYGISLEYKDLDEKKLTEALNEIITNPKYTNNAKLRSKLMHDQPMKPMDTATFWIEYVARHKGAKHFRSAALDLKWYELMLLDVFAVYLFGVCVSLSAMRLIIKKILRRLCKNADDNTKLKKNR